MDGLLYVDKPAGITSHDVVAVVRRAARSKRVGHAGTLDPFATGLLVLAVGACTRLLPYVLGEPKVYEAVIRFGFETSTDDGTGTATAQAPLPDLHDVPALAAAVTALTGAIAQQPPAFSAKHVNGQRAYALARRGVDVVLPPVAVVVHEWTLLAASDERLTVRISCGGGTYVRALARDIGRALGSAAHCESLRRVASGEASVTDAVALELLTPGAIANGTVQLHSPLPALGAVAHERLSEGALIDLSFGRPVPATETGEMAALLDGSRVVAIARRTPDNRWQPKVVLLGAADA
ncbi:MAG TPA: tRNA pseudouridine(55) synthase TruB [Gemmatimonas sp.]|nr:tRNA pseudouridine(55) synthase TruB [Gemmatimonas sp.]